MTVKTVSTTPFSDQKPGTSGLRKKTPVFMRPHYLENFVQSIFDAIGGARGKTFVLGGDGRYFNDRAAQVILRMAAANGAARVIVGQGAILSTPAASHLIRLRKTDGGIILSASHNPGGPEEDFGVKFNTPNGGPAPESVTEAIFEATKTLSEYRIFEAQDVDLSVVGRTVLGDMQIEVVDPVADYAALMESLFDFPAIRAMFSDGFTMRFDAMCAVTGPYATEILENRLGAAKGTVVNGTPLPDFGGMHPDPNPTWAKALMDEMFSAEAPISARPRTETATATWWWGAGSMSRPPTVSRCWRPMPISRPATRRGSRASPAQCPPRPRPTAWPRPSVSRSSRRRPAGNSSATCSMRAAPPSAAKRASAPAPTMCARRTGSGRCSCG